MYKRLALLGFGLFVGAAYLLQPSPARLQQPVFCPTRPFGDSTNACASTAFVQANGGGGGSGLNQLTGDVTAGPGTGSQVATLATVNANVGTFGNATNVPVITVNGKGLITAASTTPTAVQSVFGRTGAVTAQAGDYTIAQITNGLSSALAQFHFFIGNGAGVAADTVLSGDCTYGASGIICTSSNGQAFAQSAFTDTTNAANILSGTLPSGRLSGSYPNITGVDTLTVGATGTGFVINFTSASTVGLLPLANGGTNANITPSVGGIFYSTTSQFALLSGTGTAAQCLLSGTNAAPTWGSCAGGAAVSSVSNSDGSLTISPTTGNVVSSLNVAHPNTWTSTQTFANTDLCILGSGAGSTCITSDNAGASNFVMHLPAANDTLATIASAQTFTNKTWNGVAITGSFIANNTIANSNLAQAGGNSWKGNFGNATGNVNDNPWISCSTSASAVIYTNNVGTGCNTTLANTATNNTFSGAASFTSTVSITGTMTVGGPIITAIRTVTASGAITVSATTDYFICVNKTVGAATTVNLPSSPATGLTFLIKDCKGDAATNNITITPAAGNIDNSGTYVINTNLSSVAVTYNGTGWFVN